LILIGIEQYLSARVL